MNKSQETIIISAQRFQNLRNENIPQDNLSKES